MMRSSAAVQDCLAVAAAGALIGFYLGYRRRARRDAADASEQEQQPDYGDPDAWYAHYILKDGDRWAPPTYVDEQDRAAADAFFVHGTTALRGLGNASVEEGEGAAFAAWKIARQTSCFTHRCRVFAPKYRQARVANYHCFEGHAAPDGPAPGYQGGSSEPCGEAAFDVAFADVAAALELFLTKHRRPGRPWILAGHSQGAGHVTRWLNERSDRAASASTATSAACVKSAAAEGGVTIATAVPTTAPSSRAPTATSTPTTRLGGSTSGRPSRSASTRLAARRP
ncbi:DUF3089-containing protein [Aureococcus anophagefferens]|nr:DUF3089-containing protein [Aureococcus anophagefferens]